jgi:thiol-disulfide isomerase/thioredoxin
MSSLVCAPIVSGMSARAATGSGRPPPLQTTHAQFIELRPLIQVPSLKLERMDGKFTSLNEFRGRVVLLNFWATWCPPCRRELPILERLLQESAREPLAIVAVSIDEGGRKVVEPFLRQVNVTRLRPFLDPNGAIAKRAGADATTPFVLWGMPITYIIDRQGLVVGYITGEVDWMTGAARAFLRHYMAG